MSFIDTPTTRVSRCPVVVVLMKYPKASLLVVLLGFLASSTLLLSRVLCSQQGHVIHPVFHAESPVKDISNGSLELLFLLLQRSSFNFVMYYAHWCAQSTKLAYDFHRASRKFEGQVSFIAINCWTGSCRQNSLLHTYPQLFFHHTSYNPVQYKGRQKYIHLVKFIQDVIYPFTYISNSIVLQEFLGKRKPSLLAFFNGTAYQNKKYDSFFGAALQSVTKVSSLQFGVVTSFQVARLTGLEKFEQVVLINALRPPQIYPPLLNFTDVQILQWAEQNKDEHVRELEPDIMEPKEFGVMMKSVPALILFVAKNDKRQNEALVRLYHNVAMSYYNCSCEASGSPNHDSTERFPATTSYSSRKKITERTCGERLENAHVTSCQSLPLGYGNRYGVQNVCDVCRECYEMCSCDIESFPLRTSSPIFSILQGLPPLRNSCRSLRKTYQESNTLSVCCFQNSISGIRKMTLPESTGSDSDRVRTALKRDNHLKILANKFEILNGDIKDAVSKTDPGILKRLVKSLMTIFSPDVAKDGHEELVGSDSDDDVPNSVNISENSDYQEYGTCDRPGKVRVFAGAGCYSNMTLDFYVMDSRKYWTYAQALGVKNDLLTRTALVLLDVKNEAQYVSPEDMELTNASIVDFVMKYLRSNLTRRLRSAPVPIQSCWDDGCVVEVVSSTFTQLVLDMDKDVFILYYTPWCGFCKSVKPIFVALADHYKHSKHIRIARIDADVNDLPWEYTVKSYPTFIFFPAKRKDLSAIFPDDEERILENFIGFVEKHRTSHVISIKRHGTGRRFAEILYLKRRMSILRHQNNFLNWRLKSQLEARLKAEKKRFAIDRQVAVLLRDKKIAERARFDLEHEASKLSSERANLVEQLLDADEKLKIANMDRKISERTIAELRERNSELEQIVSSLEKDKHSKQLKESPDRTENTKM